MILISKYHGCGNHFIIVKEDDLIAELAETCGMNPNAEEEVLIENYQSFARKACDISIGVGADGLIVVREKPALEMVFFNCDGSRAPMCGNGIRCFANFCYDQKIRTEMNYPVKTLAGDMIIDVVSTDPFRVKIDMGEPKFSAKLIGVDYPEDGFLNRNLMLGDGDVLKIHSLFMGTIHTVVFVDDFEKVDVEKTGRAICNHPMFAEKTNVNFVKVIDEHTMEVRTYERGVGVTLACGTGACASVVVANMKGLCQGQIEVVLALGSLKIEMMEDGEVFMEGPSVKILEGRLL